MSCVSLCIRQHCTRRRQLSIPYQKARAGNTKINSFEKKKGKNQNISKMSWVYQQVAPPGVIHANAQQHRSTGLFGACTKEKAPAT
jgi:hypothetical protein